MLSCPVLSWHQQQLQIASACRPHTRPGSNLIRRPLRYQPLLRTAGSCWSLHVQHNKTNSFISFPGTNAADAQVLILHAQHKETHSHFSFSLSSEQLEHESSKMHRCSACVRSTKRPTVTPPSLFTRSYSSTNAARCTGAEAHRYYSTHILMHTTHVFIQPAYEVRNLWGKRTVNLPTLNPRLKIQGSIKSSSTLNRNPNTRHWWYGTSSAERGSPTEPSVPMPQSGSSCRSSSVSSPAAAAAAPGGAPPFGGAGGTARRFPGAAAASRSASAAASASAARASAVSL